MIRSFIAFSLPQEIRELLAGVQQELKKKQVDLRFTRPEGVHLTLKFLGNIPESDVDPIFEVMTRVCERAKPFSVYLQGLGAFPNSRNPRVIWASLEGDLVPLYTLQQELEQGLVPLKYKPESRTFQAHLTLGRIRREEGTTNLPGVLSEISFGPRHVFKLDRLVLYESELLPGGAVYKPLRAARIPD